MVKVRRPQGPPSVLDFVRPPVGKRTKTNDSSVLNQVTLYDETDSHMDPRSGFPMAPTVVVIRLLSSSDSRTPGVVPHPYLSLLEMGFPRTRLILFGKHVQD